MTLQIIKLSSLKQTELFAAHVAQVILSLPVDNGITIGLIGDLGGGKTTFTRALSAALGATVPVSSPSFVLCHEYPTSSRTTIHHWDIYRLRAELPEELFEPPRRNELRIVEWIDRSPVLSADAAALFHFSLDGEAERTVTVTINPRHPTASYWTL